MCDSVVDMVVSLGGVVSIGVLGLVLGLLVALWVGTCVIGSRRSTTSLPSLQHVRYDISPDPRPNRWKVEDS